MGLTGVNHLAFITNDMEKTVRFYRDLLGMELTTGIGEQGFRHYFFKFGSDHVAFFEYDGAQPMEYKFHGQPTTKPLGFDHVSFNVGSREELFVLKDRIEAVGFDVTGAVDHGMGWSIYFFDPNNIPLEVTWDCVEILDAPAIYDADPLAIADEGSSPRPGVWPEPARYTPPEEMVAYPGAGFAMRETLARAGKVRVVPGLPSAAARPEVKRAS